MTDLAIILAIFCVVLALWAVRRFIVKRRGAIPGLTSALSVANGGTGPSAEPQEPDFEMLTVATFAPAYHNGPPGHWPVIAVEDLPSFDEFEPVRGELTEQVSATYGGAGLKDLTITETVKDAPDIVITEIIGNDGKARLNIAGPAFNASADFSTWPQDPCRAKFAVQRSVLNRARENLPAGYDPMPVCMTVKIHLALFGR